MEETSNDVFAELMDDSADKMNHARTVALELLEMANGLEKRAEQMRHLAAIMILEAQAFAGETADLLAMEFPMKEIEEDEESNDE